MLADGPNLKPKCRSNILLIWFSGGSHHADVCSGVVLMLQTQSVSPVANHCSLRRRPPYFVMSTGFVSHSAGWGRISHSGSGKGRCPMWLLFSSEGKMEPEVDGRTRAAPINRTVVVKSLAVSLCSEPPLWVTTERMRRRIQAAEGVSSGRWLGSTLSHVFAKNYGSVQFGTAHLGRANSLQACVSTGNCSITWWVGQPDRASHVSSVAS